LASWRGIATDEVPVRTGLPPQDGRSAKTALVEEGAREAGGRVFDGSIIAAAVTLIEEAVDAFHRDEPLRAGITVELLRQTVPTHDEGRLADLLLSEAVASGSLEIRDSAVSRPGYEPVVTERQRQVMDELLGLYRGAGLAAPLVSELPETLRGRDDLWPLLKLLERRGHLVALENELFLDAEAFSATAERVATELAGATRLGPSDFREIVPVTRKHLIPILSHFDQMGLTIRGPDGRDVAGMEPN
jgi:selenocysteine-specific elongation factor